MSRHAPCPCEWNEVYPQDGCICPHATADHTESGCTGGTSNFEDLLLAWHSLGLVTVGKKEAPLVANLIVTARLLVEQLSAALAALDTEAMEGTA